MSRNLFALMASTCLGSLAMAPAAFAQDAADEAKDKDEIVVTGTLIRGVAPVGSETITVTQQDIKESGGRTVNDVLATIPQFTNLFNRTIVDVPGRTRAILQPQIHGLDTLVLLDGQRMASVGAGISGAATSIDPSIIPTGVLAGIEVVADGGSALYGSDAVGGVVNMTTIKKFDGLALDGSVTLGKAYKAFTANVTGGKAWETGSAYVSYAYSKTNSVFGLDRPFIQRNPANNQCSPGTVFVRNAGGTALAVTPLGNTLSYSSVDTNGRPTAFTVGAASCNRHTYETIIPDEDIHSVFGGFSQELGSSIRFNAKAFWSQRKTTSYSAVAIFSAENARGTLVPRTNPFWTATPAELANATFSQGVNISLAPAVGNNLPGVNKLKTWGVTGEFVADVFGDFQVRLLGNHNKADFDSFNFAGMDGTLFGQALARTDSTALNPYSPAATPGSILVAQQIVNQPTTQLGRAKQTQVRLVADGTLFSIPGGDVKIAVGGEWVRDDFRGAQETRNYLGALVGAAQALAGRRTVKSAFGELVIPVISPESGGPIHSLKLSAAGRYDHYSDFGGTFNPRFAATLQPADWVTLRATYGKSFLAPSLPQLFAPQTVNRSTTTAILPPGSSSLVFFNGGNPNARAQKARTWSLGLELKDPSNQGPRFSLTYYNVDYKDRLGQAGAGPVQLGGGDFYTAKYANFWIKDPTYDQIVAFINSPLSPIPLGNATATFPTVESLYGPNRERTANSPTYVGSGAVGNLQRLNEDGLDFDLGYKYPTSFGALDFQVAGNFVINRNSAADGLSFTDVLLTDPNFRGSFSVAADIGNFRSSLTLLHTSGRGITGANALIQPYVQAYNTVNAFFSYTFEDMGILGGTVLSLNVNNVFDVLPPVNRTAATGYDNGDLIGRSFQLGIRKKF